MDDHTTEQFHIGEETESFTLGEGVPAAGEETESFTLGEDRPAAGEEMESEFHFGEELSFSLDGDGALGESEPEIEYTISEDGNSIVIDAEEEAVDVVQDFIMDKLMAFGCSKKLMLQIRLAVEEIFVNIISYAYRPEVGKAEVFCEVSGNPLSVVIQFMDSGKPFDPLAYDEVDTSGKTFMERVGGFGIHLVKNTMDAVSYEYREGKNILRIKKSL